MEAAEVSRLEKALTIFSAASQCAAALCDYRATHRQVEAARDQVEDLRAAREQLLTELHHTREALRLERDTTDRLEQRVAELRRNRDDWMACHDQAEEQKRELEAEVATLRKELEMAKKPPAKPPAKCKKCGKTSCRC